MLIRWPYGLVNCTVIEAADWPVTVMTAPCPATRAELRGLSIDQ